jgi:3,4-dihydroxy 2-butanone 4-phosphate synthase / GTP cyclohydrolase II
MVLIIRHTSGIVCAPITTTDARRLPLDPMVSLNDSSHSTAFTVSIDYKPGGSTGISAEERAACCPRLRIQTLERTTSHDPVISFL